MKKCNKIKSFDQLEVEKGKTRTESSDIYKKYSEKLGSIEIVKEQQQLLDKQVGLDRKHYTNAEIVYNDLKHKYDL